MIWISEELVLSGIYLCAGELEGKSLFLSEMTWILGFAWETLALVLAVWIAIKHFRELQRASTGWAVGDCFTILLQTHVFYFARWGRILTIVIVSRSHSWYASFLVVSVLDLIQLSPKILVCHLRWLVYIRPFLIIFIGLNFDFRWNLRWYSSNCPSPADVCAGTTPHP